MDFRRLFSKHYTHSNIQLNKVCILWKCTEWWASSTGIGFQRTFFKTLYTFKKTIEQRMRSVKVHWVVGFKQRHWFSDELFPNIIHIQTYNLTKHALCESTLSGRLQAEAMAFKGSFSKHYTHSNIQLNNVCALWKLTAWWASSRSNVFQRKFFETLYTSKHTIEQCRRSVKVHWVVGFKQKQWVSGDVLKILYIFKQTINQCMRSLKLHWVVGFKHKQWLTEEVFWNIIHIQKCNWTKYALCEFTLSSGLQAEAMASRGSFLKHYTHSNIQLNKVCILWKYTEWWVSSRSNGFQKNFFKTLYTFKHTIEQCMRSVKVHWVVGFKQKQWVSEEVFWNIIHIQTYNWTKYAFCESTLSGGFQAEAMGFRRIFSKHYTHSNIQLNNVCALWKYTEWWGSSRSNGFQRKFFETLYTFKLTIEQSMHSVKVHWVVGFKQKQWISEEYFKNIIHLPTYNWTRYAFCESALSGGPQAQAMVSEEVF